MGIKQVIVDDFDGLTELPEGTKPEEVTYGGKTYKVYMSPVNADRFLDFLTGASPLNTKRASSGPNSTGSASGSRPRTETYGYEYADVKTWAIANGIKAANGNPVSEKTPRIGQSIYDAYHEQHEGK